MLTMECKNKYNEDSGCSLDMGRGCRFCNCTNEASAEMREGCFKLHSVDWLEEFPIQQPTDIVEVRFKNTRRGYYQNVNNLALKRGDVVAVESSPGHDIGIVSLTGDMVARQMRRVGFNPQNGEFRKVYRLAKPYDIEKWQEAIALEHDTMIRSRQIAADLRLDMKIGDVEYQGDKIKAIFYYIADERVDFRELIKIFAEQFHIKIEMKQIGARQEAGRIGGLGACGRELCCASWIAGFVSVTTGAARAQELSLNPQKLAGQCSKLKCCLGYEFDSYMDARREFPRPQSLQVMEGEYFHVKNDILAGTMTFSTSPGALVGLVTLPVARVREIIDMNRRGQKPDVLLEAGSEAPASEEPGFLNVSDQDSITRFDRKRGEGRRSGRSDGRDQGGRGDGSGRDNRGPRPDRQGGRDNREGRDSKPGYQGSRSDRQHQDGGNNRPGQGNGNRRTNNNRRGGSAGNQGNRGGNSGSQGNNRGGGGQGGQGSGSGSGNSGGQSGQGGSGSGGQGGGR